MRWMLFIFLLGGCASSSVNDFRISIEAGPGVDEEFARAIALEHLADFNHTHYSGEIIEVDLVPESWKEKCKSEQYIQDLWGREYCGATYSISHTDDPTCITSAMVIETCKDEICEFTFSKEWSICE